ncbi:MAG: RHS repeat-associated core domain-containing protein [Ignavibacteria bacterium]
MATLFLRRMEPAPPKGGDAWGYLLEGRKYDSDTSKYKFTGKERDKENNYDYFGARYYDSRIGRWESTDPIQSIEP